MLKLVVRRLLMAAPMLLIVSIFIFCLISLAPGDPAIRLAGDNSTPEQIEQIRNALRLNDPLWLRYWQWLIAAVSGDFGRSFSTGEMVSSLIADKADVTASLSAFALLLTVAIGIPLGVLAALRPDSAVDRLLTGVCAVAAAMPAFWFAIVLVIFLALRHPWLPAMGYVPLRDGWQPWLLHLILPAAALALTPAAETALQLRSALSETMSTDYVLAAFAKGVSYTRIVTKHALKNALVPVITVIGVRVSLLLGGAVTIEQVFDLNGLGTLAIASTLAGDVPVLLGLTMLATLVVIVCNLVVDIICSYLTPKARN